MGNMRGFEYHNSSDDVWPSSIGLPGGGNPVVEALHNIGQIQVGGIVTGGGTGALKNKLWQNHLTNTQY